MKILETKKNNESLEIELDVYDMVFNQKNSSNISAINDFNNKIDVSNDQDEISQNTNNEDLFKSNNIK